MKMKKLLAGLLSAAMVVTSVSFGGFGVNEVEAAAVMDTVTSVSEIDATVLAQNATANSWVEGHDNDGAASDAFTPGGKIWHSNWKAATDTNKNGNASDTNPIWIQTGFDKEVKLNKITYVGRSLTSTDNMIKDFKVYVSTQETAPTEDVSDATKWTKVTSNTLLGTAGRKTIECNDVAARWVRIVVTSVYNGDATKSHVAASEIKMYETVEKQINLNDYKTFWRYERLKNTLETQTTEDRWRFEHKLNNEWKENQHDVDNMFFSNNGNSGAVAEQNQGEWAKKESWDNKIWFTGFKGITQAYESVAITWVAPRDGYYKFKQVGNATTATLSNGKMEVKLVNAGDTTTDGTNVYTQTTGNAFEAPIVKLAANDKLRFMTVYGNDVLHYHGNLNNEDTLTWEVVPCTVKEYATQYANSVNADPNKPKALQDDVTKVKAELIDLVKNSASDEEVEAGITALEETVTRMNNYVAVTEVTVDNGETLNLTVGQAVTLTAKGNQAAYAEVTYTLEGTEGVLTQNSTNSNVFTAATPGTATIKVASVYEPTVFKTVTVNVTANKDALTEKIAEANTYLDGKYTDASKDTLRTAIEEAEKVVSNNTATEKEVNAAVTALDEAIKGLDVLYTVNVTGGKLADGTTTAAVVDGTTLTVTAEAAQPGQKFSHWELSGKPVCYASTYTFLVYNNITLTAVYVQDTTQIEKKASMFCTATFDPATSVIKFTAKRSVPAGATIVRHGMILTNQVTWNKYFVDTPQNFILGNKGMITKTGNTKGLLGNYSAGVRCTKPNTWYAKGYVEYTLNGKTETVYSDVVSYTVK